jgi:pullulanase
MNQETVVKKRTFTAAQAGPMIPDIFAQKRENFVLWRVADSTPAPELIIGLLQPGAPISFVAEQRFSLQQTADFPDLWFIPAGACHLEEDQVYHYWFEVTDAHPKRSKKRIWVTDPLAYCVDWRLLAPKPDDPHYGEDDHYPPAVIKYSQGELIPCDAGGETGVLSEEPALASLPPNNRLVIYELPTAWAKIGSAGERELGVGTFKDVASLIVPQVSGSNFSDLEVTQFGRSYLTELGINAIELLPPADSFYQRQWGYGTTNFFAPDFELGFPADYSWPAPNRDLRDLIAACHAHQVRFLVDVVMAFSRTHAYLAAATNDFFLLDPKENPDDPDAHNSRGKDEHNFRNGFGSTLFRYAAFVEGYDPLSGEQMSFSPARQLMKAALLRWMNDFHIDGLRLDSVENVYNWDFIQEYKDLAREAWQQRFAAQPANTQEADERFIVVGEELEEPLELLNQKRLDGLWHEKFKKYIRAALLGESADKDFETTVRKAIDCRSFGYNDGAQAVIYLTSHDVEGYRNERLFNFFWNNGLSEPDSIKRIRLAFACLLTSVGMPMILAGDEFADQHDLFDQQGNVKQDGGKQVDPVNFSRLGKDEWRRQMKDYVARLIKFRTSHDALAMNDTTFIHTDFNDGKRVMAWLRGQPDTDNLVVVVANFSDFGTADPSHPAAEYRVENWPATPAGKKWREITQQRDVPQEWIGREPIYPWEAKIYTLI